MRFSERVAAAARAHDSLLCIGLDVDLSRVHRPLLHESDPISVFCKHIVDATADLAAAFKPNLAFFEAYGAQGWTALSRVVDHIHESTRVPVILDAKRGDIGSTAQAYAKALFDELAADAVTVSPYLGRDAVEPFAQRDDKGVFVLVRTSNASAGEVQDLEVGGQPLYLQVARCVVEWDRHGNLGAVVGATAPRELAAVREVVGQDRWLLVPGVGAQGGDPSEAVAAGTNARGEAALINASRSILYASDGPGYAQAARAAALQVRRALMQARDRKREQA